MKKIIYILFLFPIFIFFSFTFQNDFSKAEIPVQVMQKNAFRIIKKTNNEGEIYLSYIFPVYSEFFLNNFSSEENSVYKFYLANYVGALAKTYKDKIIDGMKVSSCEYYTDIDGLGFSIYFRNLQVQSHFFGVGSDGNESEKISKNLHTEGFFVKKTHLKTDFPISSAKSAGDLKMICVLAISSWCRDCEIAQEKKEQVLSLLSSAGFIYDFATTQSGLNSELMYEDSIYHHNVFVKSVEEIEKNSSIDFWTTSVDKGLCYIFAIVFVVCGMGISFIILRIKKKL